MFNFHKNHKSLTLAIFLGFLVLSLGIAVAPAYQMQENTAPLPQMAEMSKAETEGMQIFIEEGCVACHTQQVRNIAMDNTWGERPSIPSDYYYSKQRMNIWQQSPSILGSERTGPDLTNVGQRQPGEEWHLMHLYNPRIVVKESIMPSYPWLFKEKTNPTNRDVVVAVPGEYRKKGKTIVATEDAMNLVAYLQSLKQAPLTEPVEFIPALEKETLQEGNKSEAVNLPNGKNLYMQNCSACHQSNGKGLPGAFPSLAGSSIINDDDPDLLIRIILQGYDARPEFAQMPGFQQLSDEEIAAIATHERSSWGNDAPAVTPETVKEIREYVMALNQ